MNESPLIQIEQLEVRYEEKIALHDVSLTIYEKDYLGITGPNGGGKTTFLKTLLGLKKPSNGKITFYRDQQPVDRISIGYLPQYNLVDRKFPITVSEVILSGMETRKTLWRPIQKEQKERVEEVLEQMGLKDLRSRTIGTLSGGQIQRALLGRAIASNPQMIVLDEPNTYIDKKFETQLYELLEEINRTSTIVLVSHDLRSVLPNIKHIACINKTLEYLPTNEFKNEWI